MNTGPKCFQNRCSSCRPAHKRRRYPEATRIAALPAPSTPAATGPEPTFFLMEEKGSRGLLAGGKCRTSVQVPVLTQSHCRSAVPFGSDSMAKKPGRGPCLRSVRFKRSEPTDQRKTTPCGGNGGYV